MRSWPLVELDAICRDITVGFVGTMADEYRDDGVLFLRSQNILPYVLNLEPTQVKYISKDFDKKISKSKLYPGDIAIVRTGYPGTACVIPEGFEEVNCSDLVIVRPDKSKADSKYLCYFINSPVGKGSIFGSLVGVAQQHFNVGVAKKLKLKLPPLPIQQKIASILSAYDELIENNKQRIKLLEEMAEEIYKEWFVRFRFAGYESTKFFDEKGKEVPHGTVGALPKGWQRMKLLDLYNINYGKNLPQTEILGSGAYPVYGASGIMGFYNDFNIDQKVVLITSRGNGSGEIHRTHEVAFVTNNSFIVVAKDKYKFLEIGFNLQFFNDLPLKNYCTGSAQPQLTNNAMSNIEVYLPNESVVKQFCSLSNSHIEMIDALRSKNQLLQQTRDLLLPRLISGKLSVEHLIDKEPESLPVAAEPELAYRK